MTIKELLCAWLKRMPQSRLDIFTQDQAEYPNDHSMKELIAELKEYVDHLDRNELPTANPDLPEWDMEATHMAIKYIPGTCPQEYLLYLKANKEHKLVFSSQTGDVVTPGYPPSIKRDASSHKNWKVLGTDPTKWEPYTDDYLEIHEKMKPVWKQLGM